MDRCAQFRETLKKVDAVRFGLCQVTCLYISYLRLRASEAVAGETKFIVGRIVLSQNPIIAPISQQPCVYYEVVCEEYVRRVSTDSDGNEDVSYGWESFLLERSQTDFLLADAAGQSVWVPALSFSMRVISKEKAQWCEENDDGLYCNPCQPNPPLFSLLERHGVNVSKYFGSIGKPKMRFREESFCVNDLVAVLGTPTQSLINGVPMLVINPATSDCFDEAYFEKNGWEGKHRKRWAQITSTPSLIATNHWEYFKGVNVDTLPLSYQCAGGLGAPVTMQPSPMQQQRYPPQQVYPL